MEIKLEINKFLDFAFGFVAATFLYLFTLSKGCLGGIGTTSTIECSYSGLITEMWPDAVIPVIILMLVIPAIRIAIWYREK